MPARRKRRSISTVIRIGASAWSVTSRDTKTGETTTLDLSDARDDRLGLRIGAGKEQLGNIAAALCDLHGIRGKPPRRAPKRKAGSEVASCPA